MKGIRDRFTRWYVKKGYLFGYGWPDVDDCKYDIYMRCDGFLNYYWICPKWIRPLLIFFSPSMYTSEFYGKTIVEHFQKGIEEGLQWNKEHPTVQEIMKILEETEGIRMYIGDEIIYEGGLWEDEQSR